MTRIKQSPRSFVAIALVLLLVLSILPPVSAATPGFVVVDGTLMEYTGHDDAIVIPADVYYIADDVFRAKTFIKSVQFHGNVAGIGRRAFQGCTGLVSVTIPNRVTVISTSAFSGCTSLRSVTLHPYLETIGAEAFSNCPISSVNLPQSLKTIGISAFRNTLLTSVHIPSSVTVIGDYAFTGTGTPSILGVSGSCAESYARTFNHTFVPAADQAAAPPPALPAFSPPATIVQEYRQSALPRYSGTGTPPSNWAVQGVNFMRANTSIAEEYFTDYQTGVTRAEAAYHLVHVYFDLTGKPFDLQTDADRFFADTDSPYAAKAGELGLMNGTDTARNLFSPKMVLSRQQMAVIFINLLDVAELGYHTGSTDAIAFSDQREVADWAASALRRAYHLGLLNGTDAGTPPAISPNGVLTREQLYQMLWRMFISVDKMENLYTRGTAVGTPRLVYSGVGRHPEGHIDEAYYSAPAVVDLDRDGKTEIVYTAYSIYCVDAKTGTIKWEVPSGYDRSAPAGTKPLGRCFSDVVVRDIDGDGALEIVVGHSVMYDDKGNLLGEANHRGVLAVYDQNGFFKPGWPRRMERTINSVEVGDLNGDGTEEIVIGLVGGTALERVWAFDHAGNVLDGWPQLNTATSAQSNGNRADNTGYLYGLQNDTIAIGDIDGSGTPSIVVPTDLGHIPAFDPRGQLVKANPLFGGRSWGRVGVWVDYTYEKLVENEGFGFGNRVWSAATGGMVSIPWEDVPMERRTQLNFMSNPAVITDVDGDGVNEIVVVGTVYDAAQPYPELPMYEAPFIFNGDRTRFSKSGYDWTVSPTDAGPILANDYRKVIYSQILPIVTDLTGSGMTSILWNSMSGKVMCYSLDQTFAWSHWINDRDAHTIEFASPLATADLNNDGLQEIVFGTSTPYDSRLSGRLIILDFTGNTLVSLDLPAAFDPVKTNGLGARPVIVDLDGDGKPYIILNTYLSGLTVYKMP